MTTALKKWADENGISQSELASWLNKSQPAISYLLNGKTRLSIQDAKIIIAKSNGALSWEKICGQPLPQISRVITKPKQSCQGVNPSKVTGLKNAAASRNDKEVRA